MPEKLQKLPEREILITDDEAAWNLCEHLGILDQLLADQTPQIGFTPTLKAAISQHHPTHWILALRSLGHPQPADNGFLIRAFPKSQVHLHHVTTLIETILHGSPRIARQLFTPDFHPE